MTRPCIVGVAQLTSRHDTPHPLLLAAHVARAAAADAGVDLRHIDELDVVLPISWPYADLRSQLAAELGLPEGARRLSGLSGTSPQRFVNDAAEAILRGERQAVLVAGAEAFATLKRAGKEGRKLDWPRAERGPEFKLDDAPLPSERSHNVIQAYTTFAMLDSARRAHLGLSLDEHRLEQARMMAALSEVAARNPHAWFPRAHTAEDLFAIGTGDRMVAYPFTKNTMAFMDVDMAAAILVMSDTLADTLGVHPDKRVYLHGWSHGKDLPYIAQRAELWRAPAMEQAAKSALAMAGKRIDEVEHLDLYSCFASSLGFSKDALGIRDARPLTVTGGLPYFGGPGSNYTAHSIATMVERLRSQRGAFGLISGVGMHMTEHVFGVYSTQLSQPLTPPEPSLASEPRTVDERASGPATVVAYTVLHESAGLSAIAVCELPNGHRCYARCLEQDTAQAMEREEWVGRQVTLRHDDKINLFAGAA